ncbi:MAG TPA: hypothetical protein VEL07_12265 [Planctomycetota bacterium]|nr:hypothetical protein [Planctomycetota bacterium]
MSAPPDRSRSARTDEAANPYAAPGSPPTRASGDPRDGYELVLFHPAQVAVAALFGHVLAAGALLAVNHLALDERGRAASVAAATVLYSVLAITLSDRLPQALVLGCAMVAMPVAAAYAWWTTRFLLAHVAFRGTWLAIVVGGAALLLQILSYVVVTVR